MLLLQVHATVTICHSRTADLGAEVQRADIVVAAVGVPGIVTAGMVKSGATVIDVGLTRTDDGIRGDVDLAVAEVAGLLTPMPGGTGPMTIALFCAARSRRPGTGVGSLHTPVSDATLSAVGDLASAVGRRCFQEDVRCR